MKNLRLLKVKCLWLLAVFSAIAAFFATPSYAQYLVGEPVAGNSSGALAAVDSYIDAYTATSSYATQNDMCLRIQSVYNNASLIPAGGSATVDARGFTVTNAPTGGWVCSVDPFATTNNLGLVGKSGKLLLGYVDIPAQVTWVIPGHIIIQGIGTNGTGLTGTTNFGTVIYASSSPALVEGLGSALAVLQMGLGSSAPTYGIQIRDLTVDGNNVPGCIGVLNNNAEEGSLLNNVQIFDTPAIGLHVTTYNPSASSGNGAVNSGPYQDVFINYTTSCSNCSKSTIALQVDGDNTSSLPGRSIRGFDNFTVSGNNVTSPKPDPLIYIYGVSTTVTNSHVEYCSVVCIQIGETGTATYSTYGVRLSDITVGVTNGGTVAAIGTSSSSQVGNVLIENLNNEATSNTLVDNVSGYTAADTYLGWYFLGAGASPAIFTSSESLSPSSAYDLKVPGNFYAGTLAKGSGTFKIDHPLDPANEYLYHSFVESPDMMNIYNGSVITDKHGFATVTLPHYFEALNRDFRYQLTPVGQFAQVFIAKKVDGNRFVIKTNKPGVEVSWQVTGIRHDAFANQHRIVVEEPKLSTPHNH